MPGSRFSLLLLEPGEIYFEDFSVTCIQESNNTYQRGRLRLCSKSIMFEPTDCKYPIIKVNLSYCSSISEEGDFMVINCTQIVEMLANNVVAPYVFLKNSFTLKFTFHYASSKECLHRLSQLHRASTLPPKDQQEMMEAIVHSRHSRVHFDPCWLEDLHESIQFEAKVIQVSPLVSNPGRVVLTSSRLYYQPYNREPVDVMKIRLASDMERVVRRRYLLQNSALEIYCKEHCTTKYLFLAFDKTALCDELFKKLEPKNKPNTGLDVATLQWQHGILSNYDYLLFLNSAADRSFNDLTQYPVFPWVVKDFTSATLDLEDPSIYRDLSLPVGALNPNRLKQLLERFADMPEPKFLYGSHYMAPGNVMIASIALGRLNGRLGTTYQQLVNQHARIVQRSKASAAASPEVVLKNGANVSKVVEDEEWNHAKSFDEMPGLRSVPILGTSWAMLPVVGAGIPISRILELHKLQFEKHGYIWRDTIPGAPPIVSTTRPEDAEKVFRTEGKFPERPGLFETLKAYREKRIEQFTSAGILAGNGESWWKVRSKAQQPFLKTKNVNNYIPVLGQIAQEFIERIRLIRQENNEMKPDFVNEMYRWALESVGVVGFNTRLGCLDPNLAPDSEAQKMISAANLSFAAVNELEYGLPLWKYFSTPKLRSLYEAQDFFTDTALKYVQQTLEVMKHRPADSDEDPSILEEFFIRGMSLKDATGIVVVDMLMAGIDTTSHTTSFLLYFLARNPEKQEKLRKEILSVLGPKGTQVITPSDLNDLHYLKACIKESLRMRPATVGNARIIDKELVLSGYRVPKGTLVVFLHQLMAEMDEYFPNAQEFKPERWIKGDPEESHHHKYVVLPFRPNTNVYRPTTSRTRNVATND